jgi:integrase
VRNYHALLSNILKAATETTPPLRPDNPAHKSRLSKGLAREAVFLSRQEFDRLLACIPEYYRPLVVFLAFSQARWSEATALKWADLDLDANPATVRIVKAWKKNPDGRPEIGVTKSKRGRRTVSIGAEVTRLLGSPGKPDDLIFQGKLNHERIWYGSFNTRIWKPAVEASGLAKRPNIHDLRHSGASWLMARGTPLSYIQSRLGHESITTTVHVYGHLQPDAQATMAATLSDVMFGEIPARPELTA